MNISVLALWAALAAIGLITSTMVTTPTMTQAAEKETVYCGPGGCTADKKDCEATAGKGECDKAKVYTIP